MILCRLLESAQKCAFVVICGLHVAHRSRGNTTVIGNNDGHQESHHITGESDRG